MIKIKLNNLTKKDISKKININLGTSLKYTEKIVDDLLLVLKELIKAKKISIKNFGSFEVKFKNERVGRNPKTKLEYKIKAQNTIIFVAAKKLKENLQR